MPELTYYQRNLPHRQPPGENLFITFRLADSLPRTIMEKLRAELENARQNAVSDESYAHQKRYCGRFGVYLDKAETGPTWLWQPLVAKLV